MKKVLSTIILSLLIFCFCYSQNNNNNTEKFEKRPGAFKSITMQNDSTWIIEVDLLTENPNWFPDDTLGFFINKNPKIRKLIVNHNTKAYKCPYAIDNIELEETSVFISNVIKGMEDAKLRYEKYGSQIEDINAYFDINGTIITALYPQCLP